MNVSGQSFREINELIELSLDNSISPEQFERLENIIANDDTIRRYYCEYLYLSVGLERMNVRIPATDLQEYNEIFDQELWEQLSRQEQMAPAIDIPLEKPQQEVNEYSKPSKARQKASKFQVYSFVVGVAAMLFLILFIRFAPNKSGIEVATLVDRLNAKWDQSSLNYQPGSRLWTGDGLQKLEQGVVSIEYDSGVKVVIEGPAVFEVAHSGIYLQYGRVFSDVSESGLGFTVNTPTSHFIDMGTKFGVKADINGSSELHVIKGKVQLFAGSKGEDKLARVVTENNAVRYDADRIEISNIPINNESFARSISSSSKIIWRGRQFIDMADIIGGGDGQGSGKLNAGINPSTGAYEVAAIKETQEGSSHIKSVPSCVFVDSVFVPNSVPEKFPISLDETINATFAETNGRFWGKISNGSLINLSSDYDGDGENDLIDEDQLKQNALLRGVEYGQGKVSGMLMHANMGITFDLAKIRNYYSGFTIKSFNSIAGVPDQAWKGSVDINIFVDGKLSYSQKNITYEDDVLDISIPLQRDSRYLTLVVTDCDKDNQLDWVQFGQPRLVIQQ